MDQETINLQSLIVGTPRISREQASAFTQNRPIHAVAGLIYDTAVSFNIEPAFALAEAILETGWGRSNFAQNRHNWYGYQAYFENPGAARWFETDAEGIRVALQDVAEQYISPGGAYYQNGAGRTLGGWASQWIDGNPQHWHSACQELVWLMQAAMRCQSASG